MKAGAWLIFFLLAANSAFAQHSHSSKQLELVNQAFIDFQSIDPAFEDFDDLMALVDLIGNARIVQLGEHTHGDGAVFHAKTRLIKFMHKNMGFNVVAIESGFFETDIAHKHLVEGVPTADAVQNKIYDIWADSEQALPLFEYVQQSQNDAKPLKLVGFDPQFSSDSSAKWLNQDIQVLLEQLYEGDYEKDWLSKIDELLKTIQGAGQFKIDEEQFWEYQAILNEIIAKLDEADKSLFSEEERIWKKQVIKSILAMTKSIYYRSQGAALNAGNFWEVLNSAEYIQASNERDKQMADNVLSLLNELEQGEKIIIWAANSHIVTAPGKAANSVLKENGNRPQRKPMGVYLKEALQDELYTIASVAYQGDWGVAGVSYQKGTYGPGERGSLVDLLHNSDAKYGLFDVRAIAKSIQWSHQEILVNDKWQTKTLPELAKQVDALLYIDTMYPSTKIDE